jgi:hypothetical protein
MRKTDFNRTLIMSALLIFGFLSEASDFGKSNNLALFKVCRSKDANEIFYSVNTSKDGRLNLAEPIKIFWVKCTKSGQTEPLTKIQERYSYGLKYIKVSPDSVDFHFVSFPERTLKLRKNNSGNYCVFTNVNGKEVELEQVFIKFDGGTFLMPKIARVELHAKNLDTSNLVVEIIEP